ncbi:uncharacterized protein LOC124898625 [Capsicum annuum]|uniref:uncharacterized protein LOC124898625 n=1 Tax=Capsicum annuum TaxID=4072 RepID=UPI001FB0C87D|nr:uncharacterized protein LOC124898625 [Capsicum annuum]
MVGRGEEEQLLGGLDEVVRGVVSTEKLFVGGDFNRYIGSLSGGYNDVHDDFSFREWNEGSVSLLDFARDFGLWFANFSFLKKEEYLITFSILVAKKQIVFLVFKKEDRALYKDYNVIPSENLLTQHKFLVLDLVIKKDIKKRGAEDRPRIK